MLKECVSSVNLTIFLLCYAELRTHFRAKTFIRPLSAQKVDSTHFQFFQRRCATKKFIEFSHFLRNKTLISNPWTKKTHIPIWTTWLLFVLSINHLRLSNQCLANMLLCTHLYAMVPRRWNVQLVKRKLWLKLIPNQTPELI